MRDQVSVVSIDDDGNTHIDVVSDGDVAGTVEQLVADDHDIVAVEAAQPVSITAAPSNDTHRHLQWGFDHVGFEAAWDYGTGADIDVAVIDTGVDATHPDFEGRVANGVAFLDGGNEIPETGNVDANGHGTHVAGIIAATANDSYGVAGVAPSSRILPVRVLNDCGVGWDIDVALGILWAVEQGAEVINLSLGGDNRSAAITTAITEAHNAGVLVIAAAGNTGPGGAVQWPGAEPGVISVAATNSTGALAWFSTHGDYVDIAAPGAAVISTIPGGSHEYRSGTSMAAPHVAGTAAIILSTNPALTPSEVTAALLDTATDRGPAGRDNGWGEGIIDPVAALTR